ncbi:glycine receptor alpha 1 subunit-like protein [Saccoglossus kowalevskii]|uniref:Glycine receptor alpha 1 subunit-like protein n=1 Tax=Saccoglossus kowalevskii TaxID=10224 RepID=D1LX30_SACKO|nr:glycine receptor alpha 1 subunit-like protein [Saccoglossus kowalevskii]ACY92536.1 glycine receptor alpha 1 subunit-like protein [Saccoglossus kowalevskii]
MTTSHDAHDMKNTTFFLDSLMGNYDRRLRPNFDGPPTVIYIDIHISRFDSVHEMTMDFGMTVLLRMRWNDPRLSFNLTSQHIPPSSFMVGKIWIPDLYFANEKTAYFHDVTRDNILLRFHPNGDVLFSVRLTLTLACPMKFGKFPMDKQTCHMQMESYGYTTSELEFQWKPDSPITNDTAFELQQFTVTSHEIGRCDKSYYTGEFTCIMVMFVLGRELGYYWLIIFIPSFMLVLLSWVSFWINPFASPARVSLCITSVLTITTQAIGVHETLPKVSYATAIDVWMALCLIFVTASLFEYACVNYCLQRFGKYRLKEALSKAGAEMALMNLGNVEIPLNNPVHQGNGFDGMSRDMTDAYDIEKQLKLHTEVAQALKIDIVCRYVFPACFIAFNVIYWPLILGE